MYDLQGFKVCWNVNAKFKIINFFIYLYLGQVKLYIKYIIR